jgi:hypothetical protein
MDLKKPVIGVSQFLLNITIALVDFFLSQYPNPIMKYCLIGWFLFATVNLLFSYGSVMVRGPGYLPFNYSAFRLKSEDLSWYEQMVSFVTYDKQLQYAKRAPHPPRSTFSRTARRYVLRADHYCVWSETFIGIRNHRYFMLWILWTFIYIMTYFAMHYFWATDFLPFRWWKILGIVGGIQLFPMLYMSVLHIAKSFVNLAKGITVIEKYRAEKGKIDPKKYDRGCWNNYAEVCGSKWLCWLWPCPLVCLAPGVDGFYENYEA